MVSASQAKAPVLVSFPEQQEPSLHLKAECISPRGTSANQPRSGCLLSLAAGAEHRRGRNLSCGERAKLSSLAKWGKRSPENTSCFTAPAESVMESSGPLFPLPPPQPGTTTIIITVVTTLVVPTHFHGPLCSLQRTSNTVVPLSAVLLSTVSLTCRQPRSRSRCGVRRSGGA